MLFDSLASLGRILFMASAAYAGLVLVLRLCGKRSLAKLNAFDFAVTVAFGSALATIILDRTISLAEGVLTFALLGLLQYAVSRASIASRLVRRTVRSEPRLLVSDGRFLAQAMRAERVTEGEVESAIRKKGIGRISEVAAVVLESDGSFSVIRRQGEGPLTALRSVMMPEETRA